MQLPSDGGELALLFLFLTAVVVVGCWISKHLP